MSLSLQISLSPSLSCHCLCLSLCLNLVSKSLFKSLPLSLRLSIALNVIIRRWSMLVGPPVPAQCAQCPSLPAGNHCLWRCTTNFWPPPDNIEALFSLTLSSTQDYLPYLKGFLSPSVSLCITKIRAGSLEGTWVERRVGGGHVVTHIEPWRHSKQHGYPSRASFGCWRGMNASCR